MAHACGQTVDCDLATGAERGHDCCQAVHRLTTHVTEHHRILQATSRGGGRHQDVVSLNPASTIAGRLEQEHSLTVRGHHTHQSGRLQNCGFRPHDGHRIRGVGAGREGGSRHHHLGTTSLHIRRVRTSDTTRFTVLNAANTT